MRVSAGSRAAPCSTNELSGQEARLEEQQRVLARKELELQEKETELVQRERHLMGEARKKNRQGTIINYYSLIRSTVREKALLEKERHLKKHLIPTVYQPHHLQY